MSRTDKSYESEILKEVINKHIDEVVSGTKNGFDALEAHRDQIVWDLATRIYSQSGHKVELSAVRDLVNIRIESMKHQIVIQEELMATQLAEQVAQQASETAWLRSEIETFLAEFEGDNVKAQVFIRIREVVCKNLRVDKNEITLESHISCDLGADELDTIELAIAIEEEFEEFEFEIPEDLLGSVKKWPPSYSSNSFGDSEPVACKIKDLLDFVYDKALSCSE